MYTNKSAPRRQEDSPVPPSTVAGSPRTKAVHQDGDDDRAQRPSRRPNCYLNGILAERNQKARGPGAPAKSTALPKRTGRKINGRNDHPPGLLRHHLAELRKSGLSNKTITAAGIYSEDDPQHLAELLNRVQVVKKLAPAIVYPFFGAKGQNGYSRIKPDTPRIYNDKAVKYESPRGRSNEIYLPPGVADVLERADVELLITEGEKKALKANQEGFPCIGLVGVYGWKDGKRERLLPALEWVAWEGRPVWIVFDSDGTDNPQVRNAEARLALLLANHGSMVRVVRLPAGTDSDGKPVKVGLDDFLVAHGSEALQKLLDEAEDPEPVDMVAVKVAAGELDPGTEAKNYLETTRLDETYGLRFWQGAWWKWEDGRYRELAESEVRSAVIRHLDPNYLKLGMSITSNVLDHVKAHAELPSSIEAPAWIGDPYAGWPANEILATHRKIIHLPSLVTCGEGIADATPRLFTTAALDFDFDPQAACPDKWREFLLQLWPDDRQSILTLQEWVGYLLTLDTRQQKIALLIGPARSGKGTITRIIRELVGRANVVGPTLASFATNFGLSPLLGKSVAIISDARLGGRSDRAAIVELLQNISGEDAVTIDRKYLVQLTCKLPTRLMIVSNELPRLPDASGALASRLITLCIRQSFLGREDLQLLDKLLPELPGILLWAIAGWQRLRGRGHFIQPESGKELTSELADLSSPVGAFVREKCNVGPGGSVPRSELYECYHKWALENGKAFVGDEAGFGRDLRAVVPSLGTSQPRVDGGRPRHYTGITLK